MKPEELIGSFEAGGTVSCELECNPKSSANTVNALML